MTRNLQVFKPLIRPESIQAVAGVLQSSWIGCGPKVKQFEQDFQAYLQTTNKCVAVMSCTDALELAFALLNLPPQSEIITTPITFISSNHSILYNNHIPVFADVDPSTGNILPSSIESKITDKTKAILVVHLSGTSADMEAIEDIAQRFNLKIIEDCAHSSGSFYHNGSSKSKHVGDSKNICCFSFQAVKNLPMGDGGMIVLPTQELAENTLKLRWLGIDKDTYSRTAKTGEYIWKYDVPYVGIKSNINDILGAVGVEQLKYLDSDNQRRKEIARFYKDSFKINPNIKLPNIDIESSSCHFYPILVDRRDELMSFLRTNGISCGMHYLRNDKFANYTEGNLPGAQYWEDHEITLPIHLLLTNDDLEYIVDAVEDFYNIYKGW